jgi:hypothetical protein
MQKKKESSALLGFYPGRRFAPFTLQNSVSQRMVVGAAQIELLCVVRGKFWCSRSSFSEDIMFIELFSLVLGRLGLP